MRQADRSGHCATARRTLTRNSLFRDKSWLALTVYQSRRHSFVHHAPRPADQTSAGSFLWKLIWRNKDGLTRPRRHMSRRKTRTKLQKQKKMTLSSPVITPDDIVTCTATVGDWIIIATCKRSESKQCMRELKDSPRDKKEGTVPRDFFDPTPEQHCNSAGSRAADRLVRGLQSGRRRNSLR